MKRITPYEWEVYIWFIETATTLYKLKKLCKKHFNTDDVDILDVDKIIEMFEKEKKE